MKVKKHEKKTRKNIFNKLTRFYFIVQQCLDRLLRREGSCQVQYTSCLEKTRMVKVVTLMGCAVLSFDNIGNFDTIVNDDDDVNGGDRTKG